jgi:molybdopterin-containing oxidoreductase family membrane subunit
MKKSYNLLVIVLAIIALVGIAAWIYQIQRGLIVTNMRNPFSWGLYISMWAFYVGTAAGGLVVSSAIYLFKAEKLKPFAKVASLTAFIFVIAAMVMILPDLGRVDRFYHILLYPQFGSLLPWDFIVLAIYAFLSATYILVLTRADIMKNGIKLPLFGKILQRDLSEEEYGKIVKKSERQARILAPLALPFAILIHTVTAWVLATQARPWWHGGLLAPTFIAAALSTGPAVVILGSLFVMGYRKGFEGGYSLLAKISAVSTIGLLFMYYNDFVVRAWWGEGTEVDVLKLVFSDYIATHGMEVLFMLLGVVTFVAYSTKKSGLVLGSIFMNVGVLAHRYLLMGPAYNLYPFRLPIVYGEVWEYPIAVGEVRGGAMNPQPTFAYYWDYFPSPVEIAITAGILAIVLLSFIALSKLLPLGGSESNPE